MADLFIDRRAWWSDELPRPIYRWRLLIVWDSSKPMLVAMLANPSTADEFKNDPTVARLQRRAEDLGYGGVIILNAFAFRATDPRHMFEAAEPVGRFNDSYIVDTFREGRAKGWTFLAGWGEIGRHRGRHMAMAILMKQWNIRPVCLGVTKSGQPRHPLYCAYDLPFQPWPFPA